MKTRLVVDDHPKLLEILIRLGEARGYTCLCSGTLKDAERILRVSQVVLAVVDKVMEGARESQFAAEIKRQQKVPSFS